MTPFRILAAAVLAAGLGGGSAMAAPRAEEDRHAKAADPIQTLADSRKSVVVVTRAKHGRLQAEVAAPALSADAFSVALGRTFGARGGVLASHSRPRALPARGALAGGFVAAVDGYGGRCGFAVGGLDYSGNGGAHGLDAAAAVIFCAVDQATLKTLATPEWIASKIARIPQD